MRYIGLITLNFVAIATLVCSPMSAFQCLQMMEPHTQRLLSHSSQNRVVSVLKYYRIQNQRNKNQLLATISSKNSCCDVTEDVVKTKSTIIPRSTFLLSVVSTVASITVGTLLNPTLAHAAYIDPATSLPTITRQIGRAHV